MDAFGPRRRDPYPPHPPTPEPQTKQLLRPGGGRRGEKEKEGCLLSDLPFSVFRAPGSFLSYMEEQEEEKREEERGESFSFHPTLYSTAPFCVVLASLFLLCW